MANVPELPDGQRLFEHAACGLLVTDANGLIRKVNATFCGWLGFPHLELIGKRRIQDLFTIGGRVFHQTHLLPLLQMQGSVAEVQLDMRHSDGSALPMLLNMFRRREGEHIFDELAVFIATDRRKYEHELLLARRNAEASLQALAQAQDTLVRNAAILADQSDAIVVTDLEGRILTVNAATARMTGYSEAALAGSTLGRLFRMGDGTPLQQRVAQVIGTQQEWRCELGFVRMDGSEGVCESVIKPLHDSKGNLSGAVSVNRDITERQRDAARLRELNAELARADRKKDEFLATLAHELRNPLAPLGNVLEILKRKAGDDAQLIWAQEVFERQMRHMSHLVDDLMEISRITQGRVTLRRAPTDIGAIMRAAVEAAQAIIDGGAHRLEVLVPAAPVLVDADPTRLTQVLTNLLNNAAKYTPDGGRIWFGAAAEGGQVAISVRDSGIGIAPDNLANVFTMFAQLEPALERSQGGLGIGLALVKGLVALHDGTIAAHSAGIGQGSEFIVRLPIIAGAAAPVEAPTGPVQVEETADAGKKVLVVDDNRDGADMLRMALEMLGHEVTCAYDGKGALEGAAANRPDVVVLDIGLPDMDGYAVARAMRGQPWGKDVLLVAATGWGQQKDRDATAAAGFDIHLVKPIDFAQLDSLLRSAGATGVTHVDSLAGAVDSRVA